MESRPRYAAWQEVKPIWSLESSALGKGKSEQTRAGTALRAGTVPSQFHRAFVELGSPLAQCGTSSAVRWREQLMSLGAHAHNSATKRNESHCASGARIQLWRQGIYHGLLETLPSVKTSTEGELQYVEFEAAVPGWSFCPRKAFHSQASKCTCPTGFITPRTPGHRIRRHYCRRSSSGPRL